MAIVSLAGLLKSSTVLWLLGISYDQPKEHRNISPAVICDSSYDYGYKTCDDLRHYVTPNIPGQKDSTPGFIGDYPFLYKAFYGNSIETTDAARMALAGKLYEEWKCDEHFIGYSDQYASLKQADLLNYVGRDVMPRIGKENADREIDKKRVLYCRVSNNRLLDEDLQETHVKRNLRGRVK